MTSEAQIGMAVVAGETRPGHAAAEPVIRAEKLCRDFHSGDVELRVLAGLDLVVAEGEMVAVVGPSGSGKSTLLHLLAALDTPTSGTVYFRGKSLNLLRDTQLAEYRNISVGFVWQRHHLLPEFTAAENVAMPLLVRGIPLDKAVRTAAGWLQEVGLADRVCQRAGELSGGEQQRVAIARALVSRPALLLADEPTGDLDEQNAETIFDLMRRLHQAYRLTSILATHNLALARRADRILALEHGILVEHPSGVSRGAQDQGDLGTHV